MAFQPLNAPVRAAEVAASAPPPSAPATTDPRAAAVLTLVDRVFATKPDVTAAIHQVLGPGAHPEQIPLFESIARYVSDLQNALADNLEQRESKRRKLDQNDSPANGLTTRPAAAAGASSLAAFADWKGQRFEGTSFTAPQRKKLTLEISPSANEGLRALNSEGEPEFGIAYSQLEHVFRLPVPEKTQSTHNFCAFPRNALSHAFGGPGDTGPNTLLEAVVWTSVDTLPRGAEASAVTPSGAMLSALEKSGVSIVEPTKSEFASSIPQPHRKGETAYHVKGFRGSKEGFLYFLGPGIVWGFKKPLLFFPFSAIESVSYTAVLQRTFNVVIVAMLEGRSEEIEFQMLDQADFAGIDAYVKRHGLNDASMAEARKAKKLNINPPRRGAEGADGTAQADGEDESELQKAQREAAAEAKDDDSDDEEDDENFDPGSEGESEGSGTEDEDEDDEAGGGEAEGGDEGDEE